MLREIVLFYPEVTRILCVEMIKVANLLSTQNRPLCYSGFEPSPVLQKHLQNNLISLSGLYHYLRSDLTKMDEPLSYESSYNLNECIMKITEEPQQYKCKWGTVLWYKAERISDTKVLITFTGGQFRKMMRTQYIMEFIPREQYTQIVLHFKKEMFGLPPMTSPLDIDLCMKQKLNAARIVI